MLILGFVLLFVAAICGIAYCLQTNWTAGTTKGCVPQVLNLLLTVVFICILGGIGTAGVPAGSIPVIVMILGLIGVPPEGIGMILGVDRFLDMCRTTINVTGDLAAAVVVARGEPTNAPSQEAVPEPALS